MKVHITLVGGQPMPVYHGIKAVEPDKIIFICSKGSKRYVDPIKEILKLEEDAYEIREFDPIDLDDIDKNTRSCAESVRDVEEVSVNISSGTKPWSFYFAKVFGVMDNAKLFYVDQNNVSWNLSDKTKTTIPFEMDVLFKLKKNPLNKYRKFEDYTDEDHHVAKQVEVFRSECFRSKCIKDFNSITAVLSEEFQKKIGAPEGEILSGDNYVKWNDSNSEVRIRVNSNELVLKSPHAKKLVFNSGWFELKVAKIFSEWDKAKEIRMNCIFPETQSNKVKNEIDIIVVTETKPVFVECKAGGFNSTDIDKFHSAVENYGGRGSKAVFIRGRDGFQPEQTEKLTQTNTMFYSLTDKRGIKGLYRLLDSRLLDSNM